MSSQSDSEKSKHSEEESLSDKESFTDEQKVGKTDRKKKRKPKDLLKLPAKMRDKKASPGTSKKAGIDLVAEITDSNSGEKRVGVVRDNIKHLNLDEGKLKDSKQNDGLQGTSAQTEFGVTPGINIVSQPDPIVEPSLQSNNLIVQEPPANDQDSWIKESIAVACLTTRNTTSTSHEGVRGEVPHNSPNTSEDSLELKADLHQLPFTSLANKRKAFAKKADDTLDDVSEIASDLTDTPPDSSLGQEKNQSERRPSQETSSDAKAEELSGSFEFESKVASKQTDPNEVVKSDSYEDDKDRESGKQEKVMKKSEMENSSKRKDEYIEEQCSPSKKLTEQQDSKTHKLNKKGRNEHDGQDSYEQHAQKTRNEKEGTDNKDAAEQQESLKSEDKGRLKSDSRKLEMKYVATIEILGDTADEEMAQPIEQFGLVHQDQSEVDIREDYPAGPHELHMGDVVEEKNVLDEGSGENQMEIQDNEAPVYEQDCSSEQGGVQNVSRSSSSDYQRFAGGRYARFPVDSTTTDSGIENSSNIFEASYLRNARNRTDTSESNEGSAIGSSSAAGLQNLQNWMERGAAGVSTRASSVASSPQSNEEKSGPSNVPEQAGPSTSFKSFVGLKILKVATLETIEDVPMEGTENFAESSSEGSILEVMTDAHLKREDESAKATTTFAQRPDSSVTNLGKMEMDNENLNVNLGSAGTLTNEPNAELMIQRIILASDNIKQLNRGERKDEENNSILSEETAANNPISSLNPKTSQRLAKDDPDQLSSSSQEQSRESSLADMDDAIESSDSLSKGEPQKTAANLMPTLAVGNISLVKDPDSKGRRSKRRPRKSSENPQYKKRKDVTTCGQQAGAGKDQLKRQKRDSDDSSEDDRKI